MNDDEFMKDLFSAFDDVSASDSLKSSTLDFIMSAAAVAPEATEAEPPVEQAPTVTATRGSKKRLHSKWQAMRVAAVAACLALALTGGAAYAYPASTVLVTQGDTTIELHVNVFGQVLSASANDGDTQDLIDQMGLVHTSFEDSVSRVSDSLKETNPEMPVEVVLNGVTQKVETESEIVADENNEEAVTPEPVEVNPAPVEPAVVTTEPTPVESTPVVFESTPIVETVVLPEPAAVTDSDSQTSQVSKPEGSGKSTARDTSGSTDSGSQSEAESTPIVIEEPVVPVIVDENPSAAQDETPAASDDSAEQPAAEPEEVPATDNIRTPRYHGDEEV